MAQTAQTFEGQAGTVYLLHFDQRYQHAQHYIGWAKGEGWAAATRRLHDHSHHRGGKLTQAATEAGCTLRVVRIWAGQTRTFERALKRRREAVRLCPVCMAAQGKAPKEAYGVASESRATDV